MSLVTRSFIARFGTWGGKIFYFANHLQMQIKNHNRSDNCAMKVSGSWIIDVVTIGGESKRSDGKFGQLIFRHFHEFFRSLFQRAMFFTFSSIHSTLFTSTKLYSCWPITSKSHRLALIITFNSGTKQSEFFWGSWLIPIERLFIPRPAKTLSSSNARDFSVWMGEKKKVFFSLFQKDSRALVAVVCVWNTRFVI